MPAEGHHRGLLLQRQRRRSDLLRTHRRIMDVVALAPFLDRRRADAIVRGQRSYARLTTLDRETHRLRRAGAAVKNLSQNLSRAA